MIEFNKVHKSYDSTIALYDVNLDIFQGEIFGIIGRSGAGKSTLLRSVNGLETPDSGAILIDKQNIVNLNNRGQLRALRQRMAMIFQHFNLINNKTVSNNIALPMLIQGKSQNAIQNKTQELLKLVDLEHKAQSYPAELSGGQKQRVAIARALSCDPKILLCDEATSALDPATTETILALLKKINHLYNITIVLITHEMDVIKRVCHRLAVMGQGKILEVNTLASLFDKKDSVARKLLFNQLSPELPQALQQSLRQEPNDKPLLKLIFQGPQATTPFISQCSRALNLDINILLANIDRFEQHTCGVLILEINASPPLLSQFIQRCQTHKLSVEVLGYVHNAHF